MKVANWGRLGSNCIRLTDIPGYSGQVVVQLTPVREATPAGQQLPPPFDTAVLPLIIDAINMAGQGIPFLPGDKVVVSPQHRELLSTSRLCIKLNHVYTVKRCYYLKNCSSSWMVDLEEDGHKGFDSGWFELASRVKLDSPEVESGT